MIFNITSKYQTNNKPLTKATPGFAGDKDILIIDERIDTWQKDYVIKTLGNKASEYTIHEAIGGKAGLKKAKECNPFLTITAYNMREYSPYGLDLIKALKEAGTKVIVVTSNWCSHGIESMKAGVKKCEEEAGADKYIYDWGFLRDNFKSFKDYVLYLNNYTCGNVFKESVKAIIDGKELPKYPFQLEESSQQQETPKKQDKQNLLYKILSIFVKTKENL